jgi:hypothetical protein
MRRACLGVVFELSNFAAFSDSPIPTVCSLSLSLSLSLTLTFAVSLSLSDANFRCLSLSLSLSLFITILRPRYTGAARQVAAARSLLPDLWYVCANGARSWYLYPRSGNHGNLRQGDARVHRAHSHFDGDQVVAGRISQNLYVRKCVFRIDVFVWRVCLMAFACGSSVCVDSVSVPLFVSPQL